MKITLPDKSLRELPEGSSGYDLAKDIGPGLAKSAVAVTINGIQKDLHDVIEGDVSASIITIDSDEGIEIMRHTLTAQVLARAVKNIYPNSKLAIGPTIEDGFYYDVETEEAISIDDLKKIEDEMIKIVKTKSSITKKLVSKEEALKISNLRKKESKKISENINNQLPIVNIEQGQIIFKFSEKDEKDYNSQGYDELDVLFRTNKNSDFSSIKKVASGGELSRLLLIIKSLSANNDKDLTLIFDEVDSGLSGKIASNVSEKIDNISKKNQVIAITHSPQVASKANKHWKIEKVIKNDEMTSEIFELNDESRVNEIASLISGAKITETAKKVASDLLQN